jgi:hypothetical protein
MSTFADAALQGNPLGVLRMALVNGALWACGIAWSNAIRGVTTALLPADTMDVVLAELLAAVITTVFGVGVALVAAARCFRRPERAPALNPPLPRALRR